MSVFFIEKQDITDKQKKKRDFKPMSEKRKATTGKKNIKTYKKQ